MNSLAKFVIVMGVSGSGKTETARRLATATKGAWLDADDHHPAENVDHMRRGLPLNDAMRWPWLDALCKAAIATRNELASCGITAGQSAPPIFIACSALKRRYRDYLRDHLGADLIFVFLDGPRDLILDRMNNRAGHFMPAALLDSQLADLEPLGPDEDPLTVSIMAPIDDIVWQVLDDLTARNDRESGTEPSVSADEKTTSKGG
ncbi:gluconokinase [Thalassospira sp. TSL5-1]|uniref:gluconokinase n=1 Tax=Thalassospira sp. TSL5-1 TaxID=1544451 RepID=UPI000938CB20|nr:gluconokinase [Thalassospira sp. TSL5-1]OKH88959.1 gluconate kinase [Thalassospira sp. TSL5-1]